MVSGGANCDCILDAIGKVQNFKKVCEKAKLS